MQYDRILFAAVVGGCVGLAVPAAFARGAGGQGHGSAGHAHTGSRSNSGTGLPDFANSYPYLRAESGIFGPAWAAPGPGSAFGRGGIGGFGGGFGCGGYGLGGYGLGGLGYGWGDYGYYPYNLPYFDLFPPVYYDYADGAIVPRAPAPAASDAGDMPRVGPPEMQPIPRPLRIANPYYTPAK